MATLDTTLQLTLLELAKRKDPSGDLAVIANVLARDNEILKDAPWMEANDTFSHRITRVLKMPTGSFRKLNKGVAISSAQTIVVTETIGQLADYSQADKTLVDAAPNPKAFRMGEARIKLEGLSQTLATKIIYGNSHTTPEEPTGLAPRLNDTDNDNVIDAGGSGTDTTSVYVVRWGEDGCYLIYPKGSPNFGITHTDLGEVTADAGYIESASAHSFYQAYRDYFEVKIGMAVRDNRYIGRVANIEISGTSNIFDPDDLIDLFNLMPQRGAGAVCYVNRKIFSQMDKQAMDKSNVLYSVKDVFGVPTTTFRGFPVRLVEAITNTETEVTA
jgi:hypothetical protein